MPDDLDVDGLVDWVRRLGQMARAAQEGWNLAFTVYDEGEPAEPTPPDSDREVLIFLNGLVDPFDDVARRGGGYGIRLGWFDHEKGCWRYGRGEWDHVTHWTDLPPPPAPPKQPPVAPTSASSPPDAVQDAPGADESKVVQP